MSEFASVRKSVLGALFQGIVLSGAMLAMAASAAVRGPDFNGDGRADIFWHHGSTGQSALWLMNGTAAIGSATLVPSGTWRETQFGDFNGDSRSDIVWRNDVTGQTALWLMNGGAPTATTMLISDPNWEVTHVADLNGDGRSDLIWRNTNGTVSLWLMNGTAYTLFGNYPLLPEWRITHTGDFNGDGRADLVFRNTRTGATAVWLMNGVGAIGSATIFGDANWQVTHVGDFNGDTRSDLVWRNSTTGQTAVWLMNGTAMTSGVVILSDPNWLVAEVADFNGDLRADILWRNASTGSTAMWLMNGTASTAAATVYTDPAWQVANVADVNGDGRADLLWYNVDTGTTALWTMNGTAIASGAGLVGDRQWQFTAVGDTSSPFGGLVTSAEREAMRFLTQATMGPSETDYTYLRGMSFANWLNEQFTVPALPHVPYINLVLASLPIAIPPAQQAMPSMDAFMESWWTQALTRNDQFRQRATFALGQVLVISADDGTLNNQPYALAAYHDILSANVFGNYRQLLKEVTLSPAMGVYLTMLQSQKENGTTRFPNENYAREIMQLFSIGLNELNLDGTLRLDGSNQPIPTYDQDVIVGYARIFSGWSWGGAPAGTSTALGLCPVVDNTLANHFFNPPNLNARPDCYYPYPMKGWQANHETGTKLLLTGVFASSAGPTQVVTDLESAIDSIYYHANVGPFVCKGLIQRLVTSNPTPGYVARCAAKFNNDGSGGAVTRGNMTAVWKAILLDPEARNPGMSRDTRFGKAREPVMRFNTLLRALNGKATSGRYRLTNTSSPENALAQSPYRAPTVFNFYDPDYKPDGAFATENLYAPELQILTSASAVGGNNYLYGLIYTGIAGVGGATADRLNLDYTALLPLATNVPALVDRLNLQLLAGRLSPELRGQVVKAVTALPSATAANQTDRVRAAVYLLSFGPEFTVEK